MTRDYQQLDIWNRAMVYAAELYRSSAGLPTGEHYNITAQLRSAATSVVLNIAEGSGCPTDVEFARVLTIAYRSLKEAITCLELCEALKFELPADRLQRLIDEGNQISRMAHALIQRLRR